MRTKVIAEVFDLRALYLARRRRRNLIRSTMFTAFGFILTVIAAFRWAL